MNSTRFSATFAMALILVVTLAPAPAAAQGKAKGKPNIIVILADDLGYECIGANGGKSYKTPNVDKLAARGLRFENCYVQPLCTPTRVQLMTGRYNVRNYIHFGLLDPRAVTFANLLKRAGYFTCMAGKWQLGNDRKAPANFGFDEYCLWQHTRRPPRYANPGLEINGKDMDYKNGEYGPDLVNAYALDFVTRRKDQPFLLYYTMILTHAPYQPTPDSPDWNPKAIGEKVNANNKHFGDMVTYMDKLIGKLVARLDELKIRDNTLILFLGDNGTGQGVQSRFGNGIIIGAKGQTTAAGMHVPFVANWPGVVPEGKTCKDLVDSTDFFPTLCEAAGAPIPQGLQVDGHTFFPQLRGEKGRPRDWFYCWYARDGGAEAKKEFAATDRYKLYRTGALYDFQQDPAEKKALEKSALSAGAAAAQRMLQGALDQFKNARPADLGAKKKGAKE